MAKIRVELFGSTTVHLADGTTITDLGGIKPRQIFELLAVTPGAPVSKERLADVIWDGRPPKSWVGTLESYMSLIRRRLGVARGRDSAISTTSRGYVLDPSLVEVDLDEFRRLVQPTARCSAATALTRARRALQLVSGDLLASEPYADWAVHERTLFEGEYLFACSRAVDHALELGENDVAVQVARLALRCDRSSEPAWQLLIRSLAASGSHGEALRAYAELRRVLADELGTEPGPASRQLYHALLEEDRQESTQQASPHEVRSLLRLLRQTLETFPGLDLPREDSRLAEVAVQVVGAA
jgi:DNA-binding SARP family transcriptional activator